MEDPDSRAILNLAKALEEGALDQDPFVQQYRARRMEEMKAQAKLGPQRLVNISIYACGELLVALRPLLQV